MRHAAILFIGFYQLFVSPTIKNIFGARSMCRFRPTCSEYAKEVVSQYGILKGAHLAFLRFLRCQPYG